MWQTVRLHAMLGAVLTLQFFSLKANVQNQENECKRNQIEQRLYRRKKKDKALSTFYSFSAEKADCVKTAKSELSEIEPNKLLTKRLKITPTLYQQPILPEKTSKNAR